MARARPCCVGARGGTTLTAPLFDREMRYRDRLLPVLFFLLSGCVSIPDAVRDPGPHALSIELDGTPFHPQERYQCGPAALMTVLETSGADVTLPEIIDKVYLPGRQGSLQVEMLAATRTSGRIAYRPDGTVSALLAELRLGRPVVVLQNLGVAAFPRWHYAVVVGIDPQKGQVILRSGIDKRRVTPLRTFLHTWRRSGYWAFVVLPPDELPANPDRSRYLEAVASLENAGRLRDAAIAWRAALVQWPDDKVALFGAANTALQLQEYESATRLYRQLLSSDDSIIAARNNLALALARQGLADEALIEIDKAIAGAEDPQLKIELLDTRREILQ